MPVLISDVAKTAGVSISTVSRVLNDNGYPVKPEVRDRVLAAVDLLGYVPNLSARSLRQQKRNGIALIVRSINDPYFTNIECGVTEEAFKKGVMTSVFTSIQNTEFELKYYKMILEQQYEGLVIGCGAYGGTKANKVLKQLVRQLQAQGCKVIALAPQGFEVPTICVDNESVGYSATKVLISSGHEDIAYIGGYPDHLVDVDRFNGYKRALEESRIMFNPRMAFMCDYTAQSGYENCKKLIGRQIDFTAIYIVQMIISHTE